jgi:hypothetical protein
MEAIEEPNVREASDNDRVMAEIPTPLTNWKANRCEPGR